VSVPSSGGNGQSEVSDASSSSESATDWSRFGPCISIAYILNHLYECMRACVCVCYMFRLSEFHVDKATNILILITYLLTPWNRVLLEKLTVFQPVKKFPAFYATRRHITTFTSARHLSLS